METSSADGVVGGNGRVMINVLQSPELTHEWFSKFSDSKPPTLSERLKWTRKAKVLWCSTLEAIASEIVNCIIQCEQVFWHSYSETKKINK